MSNAPASPQVREYLRRQLARNPWEASDQIVGARSRALGLKSKPAAPVEDHAEQRQAARDTLDQVRAAAFSGDVKQLQSRLDALDLAPFPDLQAAAERLRVILNARRKLPALTQHKDFNADFFNCFKEVLVSPARETAVLRERVVASFAKTTLRWKGRKMIRLLRAEAPELCLLEKEWLEMLCKSDFQKPFTWPSQEKRESNWATVVAGILMGCLLPFVIAMAFVAHQVHIEKQAKKKRAEVARLERADALARKQHWEEVRELAKARSHSGSVEDTPPNDPAGAVTARSEQATSHLQDKRPSFSIRFNSRTPDSHGGFSGPRSAVNPGEESRPDRFTEELARIRAWQRQVSERSRRQREAAEMGKSWDLSGSFSTNNSQGRWEFIFGETPEDSYLRDHEPLLETEVYEFELPDSEIAEKLRDLNRAYMFSLSPMERGVSELTAEEHRLRFIQRVRELYQQYEKRDSATGGPKASQGETVDQPTR